LSNANSQAALSGPALALALAVALVAGCITNSAGPTVVDVRNASEQNVKVHVTLNATDGSLVEEQIFVVAPGNVDEKEVASTNFTGDLRFEAWTESGLHSAAPVSAMATGATVQVTINETAMVLNAASGR
jgi:hypothetical protein